MNDENDNAPVEKRKKEREKRYSTNPFIADLVVNTTQKSIRVNQIGLGKEDNILVNQLTGEIKGTHVSTYRKVDEEEFVKIFSRNIALTFDLSAAGIKAFNVLIYAVQQGVGKDTVIIDQYTLEAFIKCHLDKDPPVTLNLSYPTLMRGLKELEKSKILAKCLRKAHYFINPSFVFNGDRIAFTTIIERKKTKSKNQLFFNGEDDDCVYDGY